MLNWEILMAAGLLLFRVNLYKRRLTIRQVNFEKTIEVMIY